MRRWLKVIFFNATGVVFMLAALECVLRWRYDIPAAPAKRLLSSATFPVPTDSKGRSFNEDGTRTINSSCAAHKPVRRVLLVGDSNIQASFLEDSQAPGQVLSDILNGEDSDVCYQVVGFGVEGFGPDQSLFAIEQMLERSGDRGPNSSQPGTGNLDVVLHVFADNDAGDLLRNNYPMEQGRLVNDGYCYTVPGMLESLLVFRRVRDAIYRKTGKYIDVSTAVASVPGGRDCVNPWAIDNKLGRLEMARRLAQADRLFFSQGRRQNFRGDHFDIEIACGVDDDVTRWQFERLTMVFSAFHDLAVRKGFNPIILVQPSEWDMTDNHDENPRSLAAFCSGYQPLNVVNFVLGAIRTSLYTGRVISLHEKFEGCSDCYFSVAELQGDNHWNAAGVRIAMAEVARAIRPH